jgi:hypothetical protein
MFADYQDINAQIIDILNANEASTFSETVDTSDSGDERRSDAAIDEARRKSAYRIFAAIGMNPAHPYWGELSTLETVVHNATIPPCYGNIGTPLIQPYDGFTGGNAGFLTGLPKPAGDIESARLNTKGSVTNYFNSQTVQAHNEARATDVMSPVSCWYSTQNGTLQFTGFAAKVPMIKVPEVLADAETMADTKIPLELAATNVKLAVGLLMKEGDSTILRLGLALMQLGEADLIDIRNGAIRTEPINLSRAVGISQQLKSI